MKKIIAPFLIWFSIFNGLFAVQEKNKLEFHGDLETFLHLKYDASDNSYFFDLPLHTRIMLYNEIDMLKTLISLDYIGGELGIGETYIAGGTEYSSIKIGYYVEEWGIGHSLNPLNVFNYRESNYPSNIFYNQLYKPNPMFTITMGKPTFYEQLVISNRDGFVQPVQDTLMGFKVSMIQSGQLLSLGFFRKLGYPPPLAFINASVEYERFSSWIEVGWEYIKNQKDRWKLLVGVKEKLADSTFYAEYIIDRSHTFFSLEEILSLSPPVSFDLKGFFHLPDKSLAFNGFFIIEFAEDSSFEPGFYLFMGKKGSYLSNWGVGNNNSIYLKLKYGF